MAYLFTKDRLRQSLRLALAGAWSHLHPDITQRLSIIQSNCPTLVDKYISSGEDGLLDLQDKPIKPDRCFGSRKSWLEYGSYLGIDMADPLPLERLQQACRTIYGIDPDAETLCLALAFPNIRIRSNTR
jgi:hypothetical protein